MENPTLHAQKVAILSRLVKESSLTLEEALLLLKDEEEEIVQETVQNPVQQHGWSYAPASPIIGSGTITIPNGFFTTTAGTANTVSVTTTASTPSSTFTADLNT